MRRSESGRKELLFNLLLANLGMKTVWVGIFWLLSPLVLPHLIRDYRPEYQQYFRIGAGGIVGRHVLGHAQFVDGDRAGASQPCPE